MSKDRSVVTLTEALLASIVRDIRGGKPLWGVLRANEYLDRSHPLRKALALEARRQIGEISTTHRSHEDTITEILNGATLLMLTPKQQEFVRSLRAEAHTPSKRHLPRRLRTTNRTTIVRSRPLRRAHAMRLSANENARYGSS